MEEELLIRFLARQCSPEEVEQIAAWISEDKANAARFFEMERIWALKEEAKYADEQEVNIEYTRLISRIEANETSRKEKRVTISRWFTYAAAIVLSGLIAIGIYSNRGKEEVVMNLVEVPLGERMELILSDGTKVSLNSGSRFTYPSTFSATNRTVTLQGEGFFEVTRKGQVPFIVQSSLLDVKVVGTVFNVKAYLGEDTEVTLEKGKVEVLVAGEPGGQERGRLELCPDQQLLCTPDKQVTLREVDAANSICWLEGGFFFDNQSLSTIKNELERRFGVNIQLDDPELQELVFTCHAKAGATLIQILDALKNTKELTYAENANTYILLTPKSKSPMK